MIRQQMIEKAARKVWDENEAEYWGDDPHRTPFDPSQPDEDGEMTAAEWLQTVTRIVDAILPQVTTIEELAALPNGSLLDHHGSVFRWRSNMSLLFDLHSSGLDYEPSDILRNGPLTVVWMP